MLVSWKYKPRDTLIQRLDPRARLIYFGCFLLSIFVFWDLRVLMLFLVLGVATVVASRIPWRDMRRTWLFIGAFVALYALVTLVTGRSIATPVTSERVLATIQAPFTILGWQPMVKITMEQVFLALSQLVRVFSIASMTILIPYTFDPALYGVTFRRLGMPDKLAFAMDLTMRFVPSLSLDLARTIDAQKARGYELERREGGLLGQVRKLAPLLVPVIIHSIISGEEITDAMDLRAFGIRPRTWLRELKYTRRDFVVIGLSATMLVVSLVAGLAGRGALWIP